jgi:CheY-like chemotaxis protein
VRVRQVLLNLLANSTRFTEKGWIRISADAQDGRALVAVQDTGSGIDPGKLFRAFEEFSMLDDEHAGEGSGLGLAISKKIVELHGGAMWLESQLGLGTTVSFTLPLREETASAPARLVTGARRRPSQDKPAVLVLHDDVRATAALARYIEGYSFVLAPTLAQAVEEADALLPVALVADASWAPRWEEVEAAIQGTSTRPWVLCPLPGTGSLRDALGVQGFLPKPVRQPDLLSALESLPREPEKVLVVDDEAHMVRLFGRMLRVLKPHMQVLEAFGGREALEIVRAERPDLVLLDLFMPDGNGYDVITALRADPDLEDVQVIVVTVRGVAEQEVRPLANEIRCGRGVGFSLTETISVLQTLLPAVTRPVLAGPANGEPSSAARSD